MRIRSVTCFVNVSNSPADGETIRRAGALAREARAGLQAQGFEVQTMRLATQPLSLLPGDVVSLAGELQGRCGREGFEYVSLGPVLATTGDADLSPAGERRGRLLLGFGLASWLYSIAFLALMLGDTSMGMINGYFGPRRLAPIGFSEHKVDQAWIIDRGRSVSDDRLNRAMAFVKKSGVKFHWGEDGADDFDENATREQLRDYLTVLDLVSEFKADCVGWQYQLGLVPLRPVVRRDPHLHYWKLTVGFAGPREPDFSRESRQP